MALKRYFKKAKRLVVNSNPVLKSVTGGVSNSGKSDDTGARATAAKRLVNTRQQAGGGQINFNTEVAGEPEAAPAAAAPAASTSETQPTSTTSKPTITPQMGSREKGQAFIDYLRRLQESGGQ